MRGRKVVLTMRGGGTDQEKSNQSDYVYLGNLGGEEDD